MMPTRSSPGMSAAVNTATTPGAASASAVSMATIVGAGVRRSARSAPCSMPGHAACRRCSRGRRATAASASYLVAAGCRCRRAAAAATGCALGQRLDRVEDLHVAGAAAEVGAEVAGGVVAGQRRALLVDQRLGPHDDAGGAEAALQGAAGGERVGVAAALVLVEAFEGDDRPCPRPGSSETWQATTALPSSSTVQQPHWPEGEQPSLGDVTSSSSRSAASRWGWAARHDRRLAVEREGGDGLVDGGHGRLPVSGSESGVVLGDELVHLGPAVAVEVEDRAPCSGRTSRGRSVATTTSSPVGRRPGPAPRPTGR